MFRFLSRKSVSELFVILCLPAALACAGSSGFTGTSNSAKKKSQEQPTSAKERENSDTNKAEPEKTNDLKNGQTVTSNADKPENIVTQTNPATSTQIDPQDTASVQPPIEKVEGQEVLNSCDSCMARARELGQSIGLNIDTAVARNLYFYKIDRSKNLCDIHFLPTIDTPTASHSGQASSILGNQIALYCPCDCPFYVNEPDPYSSGFY